MLEGSQIRQALLNDATVHALVGSRIRPLRAMKGDGAPYLIWTRISGERLINLDNSQVDDLEPIRIQLDGYGRTFDEAEAVAHAVRNAMFNSFKIGSCNDLQGLDEETGLFRSTLDLNVWFTFNQP